MSNAGRPTWSKTVYRLRGFPNNFTRDDLSQSIQQAHHIQSTDFKIHSLSLDLDEGDLPRRKVATISFRETPLATLCEVENQLWSFEATSHHSDETYRAYLSSRLDGLTPLTPEQNDKKCDTDCIFVHGWGGNPIGSLIADDPNYVWLRDDIPQRFPKLRIWTYGYGSRLDDASHVSDPFEYALRLKDALQAFRRSPQNRPMVFLVHSLGGLIFKQMIVSMSKSSDAADQRNLRLIKGALFFGVPGQGMDTKTLASMVEGLPSQYTVNLLDENMGFRQREALDEDLYSVVKEYHLILYCFFEMRKTPTLVKKPDGAGWTRSGELSLLVKPASAIFDQYHRSNHGISLNKDHSGLVKFSRNDNEDYSRVCSALNELIQMKNGATELRAGASPEEEQQTFELQQQFIDSLYAHALQSRTRQICEAATGTYDWIFPCSENVTINSDNSDAEITSGENSDDEDHSDGGMDFELQTCPEHHASDQSDVSEDSSEMDFVAEDASISYQERQIYDRCRLVTDPDTSFIHWLRQGSEVYWVTGKPGSGKSTLVKFIAQHPKTEATLREWAGSKEVTIVSFYFWISGAALQRSVIGLLQSIFHQILNRNRHLIAALFPYEWRRTQRSEPFDWTEESFIHAIDCLAELEDDGQHRFCFFIDGLDEYEGSHSQDWLCDLLLKLGGMDHIKLCVSSRYWPVFQSAFFGCPTLKLEEWTRSDVEKFVYQELETHPLWIELTTVEADQTTKLIKAISSLAEGVFLWVVLTVRALVKDLVKGVTIECLFERLLHLPKSLNGFFDRILKDLDAEDRDYVIKALLITRDFGGFIGVPIVILSELDMADRAIIRRARAHRQSLTEWEDRAVRTERRLISLCSDLLLLRHIILEDYGDLAVTFSPSAQLFHRTLADYVRNPVTSQLLRLSDGSSFDACAWFDETFMVVCQRLPVSIDGPGLLRFISNLYEIWMEPFLNGFRINRTRIALPDQQYLTELDSALFMLFKTAALGPRRASEIEISVSDFTRLSEVQSHFRELNAYLDAEGEAYGGSLSCWLRGESIADIAKETLEEALEWRKYVERKYGNRCCKQI